MKEFMFYISNAADAKAALSKEEHLAFVRQCETYIGQLKAGGRLIAAQPIVREGVIVSKKERDWQVAAIDTSARVQVGYYHLLAADMEEAVAMAKENPEFAFVPSATIEIRPVKMKEEATDFVYPKGRD